MKEFNQLKNEFSILLEKGITTAEKLGYESQSKSLLATKEYFDNKDLLIVTVGEAKRGKSSLLEALVEELGLFPIDVNVCTNIVTIVKYGEEEKITAVVEELDKDDNITEKEISITREQIPKYASEKFNKGNEKNVSCLKIEVPNEKLKQGLVFVDAPGVGSLNIAHAEITYGFLPQADVLLFVSDASAPLTETELKFLETAHEHCKNIIFPITKIDKFSDYDIVEADNKAKISKHIGIDENKIVVVPVSNTAKQMYLKTKNEELYNMSNFKVLEKLIWQTITEKRANILITPFLATMADEINSIKNDLQLKYRALSAGSKASKEIVDKLNSEAEMRRKLQEENARWVGIITTELNKLSSHINNNVIASLQSDLSTYISAELPMGGMANPRISKAKRSAIMSKVNSDIVKTIFDTKKTLMDRTTQLCMQINKELGLDMCVNGSIYSDIGFKKEDELFLVKPKLPALDKAMTVGRMFTFGSAGGTAFGSIAGTIIGGTLGAFGGPGGVVAGMEIGKWAGAAIGAAAGGIKGLFDARRTIKGETVGDIRSALMNYISTSIVCIRQMVSNVIFELNTQLPTEFRQQLNQRINRSLKTSHEIEENIKLTTEAAKKHCDELKEQAQLIVDIEQQMVAVAKEIKL